MPLGIQSSEEKEQAHESGNQQLPEERAGTGVNIGLSQYSGLRSGDEFEHPLA